MRARNDGSAEIESEADAQGAPAFFGRRKGKQLRLHQAELMQGFLPKVTVDLEIARRDPQLIFDVPVDEIQLEIGFGGAEHLIAQAQKFPRVGFIGCEAFVNGVAKALSQIEELNIRNIRLYPSDALELLRELKRDSISRLYLLYPDPWPKPRQSKRRIVSKNFLDLLASVLKSGAEIRFATDIDDYSAWTLSRVLEHPNFLWSPVGQTSWTVPWEGWFSTRYEAKALREGRSPTYLTFVRRES